MVTEDVSQFRVGSKVVIRNNPRNGAAIEIVGTIRAFHRGKGVLDCDLVDVEFTDPRDGRLQELPFDPHDLERGDARTLIAMAERHEAQAAGLRRLAIEASN